MIGLFAKSLYLRTGSKRRLPEQIGSDWGLKFADTSDAQSSDSDLTDILEDVSDFEDSRDPQAQD